MEWLGPDIETIAREKAGIFRAGRPEICGMRSPPQSLLEAARNCGAALRVLGRDFDAIAGPRDRWDFVDGDLELRDLPLPALAGRVQLDNAAGAIAAWNSIHARLPLLRPAVEQGLRSVSLPGRFQRVVAPSGVEWVLDVAHNPQAARTLADNLRALPRAAVTVGVCAMLADKDAPGVLEAVAPHCDRLLAAGTSGPRGLTDGELEDRARAAGIDIERAGTLRQALETVAAEARAGDRVVVFGSFHTVGSALEWLEQQGLILPAPWMNSSRHA
jgi:dihydrofolate synthase/folylpolyglutamate synthase